MATDKDEAKSIPNLGRNWLVNRPLYLIHWLYAYR